MLDRAFALGYRAGLRAGYNQAIKDEAAAVKKIKKIKELLEGRTALIFFRKKVEDIIYDRDRVNASDPKDQ